ncbi:AT DNA-binding motif [Cordyceps militaris]|uniref:AT DNA-binding motif n=1 Tax=Cordyceps militaris TaxID=73501 RepID=A0A2H4SS74_CORMI|nr:AT DNA-binding motif [Cordyceps militaris]
MTPAFIADSDEESETDTFSPPPAAQVEEPSFASTNSEPVSLATSSTDTTFFQGIYHEQQIAAAREQQLRTHGGLNETLPPTAPTGTEQTDPVSLPSQYPEGTPLTVGDTNRSNASNPIKSAIMRGKKVRQDTVRAADPYAFPSSAEEDESRGGHRAGRMMAVSSSLAYRGAGVGGVDEEDAMGPPLRKRQRLNPRGNDCIDSSLPPTAPQMYSSIPPTMPPVVVDEITNNENTERSSTQLVPTMDISDDPSLMIHPRGLTSNQKQQYIAVDLAAREGNEDIMNQTPRQSRARSQRQRTNATASKPETPKRRAKSKPDKDVVKSPQLGTPEQTQEGKHIVVLDDSEDEAYGGNDTQVVKEIERKLAADEIQPLTTPATKRTRGRPKKAESQAQGALAIPSEPKRAPESGRALKKRGRPRKAETAVVVETKLEVVEEDEAQTEVPEGGGAKHEKIITTDVKTEDQTKPNDVKVDDEKAAGGSLVTAKKTPQKPAGKRIETPQMGSTGKPLYRIGLSKRSRIAPLLKSLPK